MPINPKTKEKVSWKEFFKQWKKGMEQVTPLQQKTIMGYGYVITLIGIVWGFIFSLMLKQYWLSVILLGGLLVSSIQTLGNFQSKWALARIEKLYQQADIEIKDKEVKNV